MSVKKVIGGLGLQAIKDWANARFMPRSPYVIVRLKFGAEFVGQTWELRNQDRPSEVYTGTVDSSRVVDVVVLETSATYVLTVDATQDVGGETVIRYINTDRYFGIYPRVIKYVEIAPWSTGTDAQIAAMLAASRAGHLDLYDEAGWRVGDTRTVSMTAIGGVKSSNLAQNVALVLVNHGGYYDTDGNEVGFIWQQLDSLSVSDAMNGSKSTNVGGWDACPMRTFLNNGYRAALPEYLRNGLRKVSVVTADNSNSTLTIASEDWCFLPAEKEVFGSNNRANSAAEASLSQWEWYKTSGNRIKRIGGNNQAWWLRSPSYSSNQVFCTVSNNGTVDTEYASSYRGVAPCGCI